MGEQDGPILYVVVVGFHHKRGCQVEYSFPELVPGHPNECPSGWKYLPTLALPDGSHNFDSDTVYFHLPSLTKPKQTVYGISCFRQIPVEKIKNRTSDITRGTVQKSVCVLSRIPLYGQIQVKMCLITHAYFEEGDFSKVSILEDTYYHLNAVMLQNDVSQQTFVGLSARDFILQWKHKAVLMFKLLLLEKRVIFFKSPVHPLCSTILTLISLFPEMIESGLHQSVSIRLSRPMSPMPEYSDEDSSPTDNKTFMNGNFATPIEVKTIGQKNIISTVANDTIDESLNDKMENIEIKEENSVSIQNTIDESLNYKMENIEIKEENSVSIQNGSISEVGVEITESINPTKEISPDDSVSNLGDKNNSLRRDLSSDTISDVVQNNMTYLTNLSTQACGFPLAIFTKGSMCLPYLSLPYLDLLADVNVRSYVVGATNILFKQKRQLYDILVDVDSNRIECQDPNLRKYLHLTTEDLRFADYIVKHVSEERQDVFLDGVGWEGGDEWIRTQFRVYLLCLLRTSMLPDGSKELDHFNSSFVSAWRESHNYKIWLSGVNPGILDVHPSHPFAGQLSVADMKLRLAHTMQNTESGRKINQAMASTGKAVANTGKAVGGALSQAKGAFSSWWSNFMVSPEQGQNISHQSAESTICDDLSDNEMNIPKIIGNGKEIQEPCNGKVAGNANVAKCEINGIESNDHQPGEIYIV